MVDSILMLLMGIGVSYLGYSPLSTKNAGIDGIRPWHHRLPSSAGWAAACLHRPRDFGRADVESIVADQQYSSLGRLLQRRGESS